MLLRHLQTTRFVWTYWVQGHLMQAHLLSARCRLTPPQLLVRLREGHTQSLCDSEWLTESPLWSLLQRGSPRKNPLQWEVPEVTEGDSGGPEIQEASGVVLYVCEGLVPVPDQP